MADDVTLPATGAVIAADEVAGKKYQRMKIAHGPDGSATDTSEEAPFPVAAIGGATAEKQTELAALIGAKADASATSDTGSFSLLAFIKRGQEKLTSIAGGIVNIITALGAIGDAAWASGNGSVIALLKTIATAAGDTTTPLPVKGQAPLVRIAPTLQTSAYTAGTVLFATTAIANLAPSNDQGIVLESLFVVDKDDEGAAITLHFFSSNVALGTLGSAPSLSDADAASSWLGSVDIVTGDYKDLGGVKVASLKGIGLNLQPGSGARAVWVGGIAVGTPTFAGTTDLTLGFGALG